MPWAFDSEEFLDFGFEQSRPLAPFPSGDFPTGCDAKEVKCQ